MEFNEKLQQLRKKKGLTQEELAEILYVSRTAISKWESGRGLPNIESLKGISEYFSVSLDELFSGEEILGIAQSEGKQKESYIKDLVFGLLDIGISLLLFLPFFGQKGDGIINEVSLISLVDIQLWLKTVYLVIVISMIVFGILTLVLQNCNAFFWVRNKNKLSLALSIAGIILFIIGRQPYAAIFIFVFLIIKVLMLKMVTAG